MALAPVREPLVVACGFSASVGAPLASNAGCMALGDAADLGDQAELGASPVRNSLAAGPPRPPGRMGAEPNDWVMPTTGPFGPSPSASRHTLGVELNRYAVRGFRTLL